MLFRSAKLIEAGLDFESAALMALPSRIELISSEDDPRDLILNLISLNEFPTFSEKKKN